MSSVRFGNSGTELTFRPVFYWILLTFLHLPSLPYLTIHIFVIWSQLSRPSSHLLITAPSILYLRLHRSLATAVDSLHNSQLCNSICSFFSVSSSLPWSPPPPFDYIYFLFTTAWLCTFCFYKRTITDDCTIQIAWIENNVRVPTISEPRPSHFGWAGLGWAISCLGISTG